MDERVLKRFAGGETCDPETGAQPVVAVERGMPERVEPLPDGIRDHACLVLGRTRQQKRELFSAPARRKALQSVQERGEDTNDIVAGGMAVAVVGYVVFGLSTSIFLALHSSQTLRVLPRPRTRGRDLGLFNLTNTVPSLIMPWLTLALVPVFGFAALFMLLAALCMIACVLLITLPRA